MNWSDVSATCRLDWRRSRWLLAALCLLASVAVAALWLSALPRIGCEIGSGLVLAYAGWLLHREGRRPDCALARPGGDAEWQVECGGRVESLRHVDASSRGGLVVLMLADGRGKLRRWIWWPDTLDARGRRALRLAAVAARGNETARADA